MFCKKIQLKYFVAKTLPYSNAYKRENVSFNCLASAEMSMLMLSRARTV